MDNTTELMVRKLDEAVLLKKKIKYQLTKDIRFKGFEDMPIEDMAAKYAQADELSKSIRDSLAFEGLLTNWSEQPE